jgi:ADP-dependent NAD(P)H-hydrate dehydratase / NAD(P)H-hydrate epimerase
MHRDAADARERCPRGAALKEGALVKLLSAAESRELDRLSQEKYGIASYALMTRAGEAVAAAVMRRWHHAVRHGVLVVAGKGNNGGDGMVAARALMGEQVPVRAILLASASALKGDAARAHSEFVKAGGVVIEGAREAELEAAMDGRTGVIVDAIFGTGLNAEVKGLARRAIEGINGAGARVLAVDIASGVNADTGAVMGAAVRAAVTVTFGFAKFGHVSYPGAELCGELEIAEIGFAPAAIGEIAPRGKFFDVAEARQYLHARPRNSHKGNYGHVMVIAGSRGKSGAAILASRGALRMGAGLVTAAIPEAIGAVVAAGQAELMTEPVADRDGHFDGKDAPRVLAQLIEGKDALAVGPGIGQSDDTRALIEWLIAEGVAPRRPMLIDADGLNMVAQIGAVALKIARGPVVLTPHPGEAARLLGTTTAEINANRIGAARQLSDLSGAAVLLKGARTVIAGTGGEIYVNASGNPGMATPGMGDVLSGIVGALLGQRFTPLDALAFGTFVHGYAADRLAARIGPVGYLAGDLAVELPSSLAALGA